MGIRGWARLLLAVFCLQGRAAAQTVEPERSGQDDYLKRAIFADGRLWVLSDAGVLSSIEPTAAKRVREPTPAAVLDICNWAGRPVLVTAEVKKTPVWVLYLRSPDGRWRDFASARREGDRLVGLTCHDGVGELLTDRRLLLLRSGQIGLFGAIPVTLKGAVRRGVIASLHPEPDALWVGIDAGEWGGGLLRIDERTGVVSNIERKGKELCSGPLNADCDPVNGIEDEPWRPGCLLVSVGLEHMAAHGRLVEVCPHRITTLAEIPIDDEIVGMESVPFFGLVRAGDGLWAAAGDGLYRVSQAGASHASALPEFEDIGGVQVNFDDPHFVLVRTQINQRVSLSGATPLLVARP